MKRKRKDAFKDAVIAQRCCSACWLQAVGPHETLSWELVNILFCIQYFSLNLYVVIVLQSSSRLRCLDVLQNVLNVMNFILLL